MKLSSGILLLCALGTAAPGFAATPHNLILFVPDGLRSQIVDAATAPTMARIREEGVDFRNSHSLFPTFTTANASAFATGHQLGDTGDYSNTVYTDFPVAAGGGTVTPFLESDPVLREVAAHFGDNYVNEDLVLASAAAAHFSTAAVGKLGPVGIFDLEALQKPGGADQTLIVDDSTGNEGGVPLGQDWLDAIKAAKVSLKAPGRGDNGVTGDNGHPGTWIPNLAQQQYFLEMTLKVILPRFKAANKPFVLIYWSRDPDGSQHNQGDSPDAVVPGINGPTSLSAIRSGDGALAAIEQGLKSLGLAETTNIVVAADHGFSTISKESATSFAAKAHFADTQEGELPAGFLAIDLVAALQREDRAIRLFDPDINDAEVDWHAGVHPRQGNGLIGRSTQVPQVVVAANGGSDLVYLPQKLPLSHARRLAVKLVHALLEQDYVSGLFVDTVRLGEIPGTLSLKDIGLSGSAVLPSPAIVVGFRSFHTECQRPGNPIVCTAEIADSRLQQGQGMHGSFSRADTWNFMAARGPDFRKAYVDDLPASNADIGITIAHLLGIDVKPKGSLLGRVLTEALSASTDGESAPVSARTVESKPGAHGLKTILKVQSVGPHSYYTAAGFSGRAVGVDTK